MLPPEVLDVGLECGSQRTVVIETSHTTVDLETLDVEELPFQQVFAVLSVVLLGQVHWLFLFVILNGSTSAKTAIRLTFFSSSILLIKNLF